jgi:hypothetical protein
MEAAGRASFPALPVDPQVVGQQPVSRCLVLEPVQVGGVPPRQDPPADAEQADDRPREGEHDVPGAAYPVVGGSVRVPDAQMRQVTAYPAHESGQAVIVE